MRICYFGTYEHDYPRNVMIINGLRRAGNSVYECHEHIWKGQRDKTGAYRGRMLFKMLARITQAYIRLIHRYMDMPEHDVMVVGYIGHLDMLVAWVLARLRNVPIVFNVTLSLFDTFTSGRSLVSPKSLMGGMFWLVDYLSCHAADLLITDTRTYANYFVQTFGIPAERCCVVPLGANDDLFKPLPKRKKHPVDPFEVIFVGKFVPLHGCITIVEAAELLREEPVHFTMIGDGQDYPAVQELIRELELTNVTLTGWIDYQQLPEYYAQSDLCLGNFGASARASRAISNKVYEAMALGLPVLSGDTPGLRSELLTGEEVWVCKVADTDDMARKILALMQQPELRERIARSGHEAYQQRYTLQKIGERATACLSKVQRISLEHRASNVKTRLVKTGERLIPNESSSREEYLAFVRHLTAYEFALQQISHEHVVLDLGCRVGYGTHFLSHRVKRIMGIDVEPEAILHASRTYDSPNCTFMVYDGHTIPFDDTTLDMVVSFQVIEHIENDAHYVSEVYRVLKPGGTFIATTPDRSYRLNPGQKPWNRYHVREYASEDLHQVVSSVFPHVQMFHVCADDNIYNMEVERVQWARTIAKWDVLRMREAIPEQIVPMVRSIVKTLTFRDKDTQQAQDVSYSMANFSIKQHPAPNSLDLLCVCRK